MDDAERRALRETWYKQLAKTETQLNEYLSYLNAPPEPFSDLRRPDLHRDTQWIKPKIRKRQERAEEVQKGEQ